MPIDEVISMMNRVPGGKSNTSLAMHDAMKRGISWHTFANTTEYEEFAGVEHGDAKEDEQESRIAYQVEACVTLDVAEKSLKSTYDQWEVSELNDDIRSLLVTWTADDIRELLGIKRKGTKLSVTCAQPFEIDQMMVGGLNGARFRLDLTMDGQMVRQTAYVNTDSTNGNWGQIGIPGSHVSEFRTIKRSNGDNPIFARSAPEEYNDNES